MRAKSFGLILFSLSSSMLWGATNTWSGNSSANWSDGGNWSAGTPVNGQDLSFPAGGNNANNTNNLNNLSIPSITINGNTLYTLNGNSLTLTGPTPQINFNPTPGTLGGKTINLGLIIGGNLTINNGTTSGTNQILGGISDNGGGFSLTYNGNIEFTLGGTNTYTGGTIIAQNVLGTTTSSLPSAGGVNIQDPNGYLVFEQGSAGTYSGQISGPGNFLVSGDGSAPNISITLTSPLNNWSGETDIDNDGVLIGSTQTISSSTSSISFLELTPGGVFNLNQNFAGTFSPPILGVGAVVISGGGVVTLSNAGNTYNQGTTVTTGTVSVGAESNLGAAGTTVTLGQATTDTPAFQANASFTTARPFQLNASTCIIDPNGNTLTYTGTASGSGALQVGIATGGILLQQGTFNYTGGTTVTSGTLTVAAAGTLPAAGTSPQGDIILNSPALFALDVASANQLTVGNISGSGNINLGVNILTATISQGTPLSPLPYSGVISGVGGQIIMTGTGVWGWSNSSTYTGPTTINNGTLMMTGTGVFPATSPLTINSPGAFDISTASSAQTVLNVSGSGAINLGTKTLTVNTTSNTTFSGNIAPTAGSIISNGPSTWSWSGTNNYTGSTTINNGTLAIIGGGNFPPNSALTINSPGSFDISAATSEQTATNITETGNINLGGNNLRALITSSTTYSGVIGGTGQVIKDSSSTWSLNNAQTYSGGTIIDNGTLAITGTGSLNATGLVGINSSGVFDISGATNPQTVGNVDGKGNINLGANTLTVNITSASPIGVSGVISGVNGQIIKNGPSSWGYFGANTYTGGTTINNGELLVGVAGMIPSTGPLTINSPGVFDISTANNAQIIGTLSGNGTINLGTNTLTHVPTGPTTFSGTINGGSSSVFNHNAPFNFTLSGISPLMTGELRISQGTVLAGATNIFPNLRLLHIASGAIFSLNGFDQSMGDLDSGGTLILGVNTFTNNSKSDRTFSGVIQGNGSSKFIHSGAFTLTLQGVSTTSGAFEVAGGIVKVDSGASLLNATTTVDAGGRLKGTGSVGTLNNFGVVQPGSSIGTLHVVGPYTESGTLEIEVNEQGQSSLLDVTGAITINPGTTLHIKPKHGTYNSSLVYTVETNTGARTGTYITLKTSLANRFNVTAIYNPNDIQIALGVTPFPIIINGGNAGAVAACFETIPGGNGTDHEVVLNALEDLSDDLGALRKAFNQLQPSSLGALPLAQQNNDILVRSALSQRFSYRRTIDLPYPRPAPATDATAESTDSTPAPEMPAVRKGGIWIEGLGKYAHQDQKQDNPGYNAATGGGLIGADYRFFDRAYFGTALGYTSTKLHIHEASGHANIHSAYGALYGTLFSKRAFFDASAIASYNHYHVNRHIHFTGINRHARNSHNGYQLGGSLGMGFFINTQNLQIQPYNRADFIFTHQNKFREHGAQSINLRVKHKDSRYVRNDLGIKVLHCFEFSKASLIPYIKASWIWEQQLDKGHLSASFTESPCQFIVIGMHPIRSLFAPSLGLTTLAFKDALSFAFHYDAEMGSKFWENRVYLNFTYRY